jgi:hypothetical protein
MSGHVHNYRVVDTWEKKKDGLIIFVFHYACSCGDSYIEEE